MAYKKHDNVKKAICLQYVAIKKTIAWKLNTKKTFLIFNFQPFFTFCKIWTTPPHDGIQKPPFFIYNIK
jgi:hypothetical protein